MKPNTVSEKLVVGVSLSALFDTSESQRIFDAKIGGDEAAFIQHQISNEGKVLQQGTAYPLIEALQRLNKVAGTQLVEVVILSRHHPSAALRAFKSVHDHEAGIQRAAFVRDAPIAKYLIPYNIGLFLSANPTDVRAAIGQNIAAAIVRPPPAGFQQDYSQLRIAFDGDAVLFSDEGDRRFHENRARYFDTEYANAQIPMPDGPFANFLRWLAYIRSNFQPVKSAIRIALITARTEPAAQRILYTFRHWNTDFAIDEAHFVGTLDKGPIVAAFNPHIFFDDSPKNADSASRNVPTGEVPFGINATVDPALIELPVSVYDRATAAPADPALYSTKKAYEERLRQIFVPYTPLSSNGVIDPRFRKFIADTLDLSKSKRASILQNIARYDLSSMTSHRPMLNRENGDRLHGKLEQIKRLADASDQGHLNL